MRILMVSQMYPGPEDPDFGVFIRQLEVALHARGHEIERAVLNRRGGGKRKYLTLARRVAVRAARFRPDVVYAHFLVPPGLFGALAARAPLVVTAHGQDVINAGTIPGVLAATRFVVRRAAAVIIVSDYLRRELEAKVPEVGGKTAVINCGVDLERFSGAPPEPARARLGWDGDGPAFLFVGGLIDEKNPVGLADAFARLGRGRLAVVGTGPLRAALEGREGVRLVGPVPHDEVARWLAACDVLCQPSLWEAFGQATLEGMACERSVLATRVGAPPEFVTPGAGVLVDPTDVEAMRDGLAQAADLPHPNLTARAAAAHHDVNAQARRIEEVLAWAARS